MGRAGQPRTDDPLSADSRSPGEVFAEDGTACTLDQSAARDCAVRGRDPISLSAWAFLFATIFWSLLAPWWTFPGRRVDDHVSLVGNLASTHVALWLLMLWMVVLGGIVPFGLIVSALRHISATRAGITAMLEPVVAIVVAWAWLGESLRPVQLSGAVLTLLGIGLAQTAR